MHRRTRRGQRVPCFERFYAGVAHSHKAFGSLYTSQKAGSARTSGQGNNTGDLHSDPAQTCGCLEEPHAAAFVLAINQSQCKLQNKEEPLQIKPPRTTIRQCMYGSGSHRRYVAEAEMFDCAYLAWATTTEHPGYPFWG